MSIQVQLRLAATRHGRIALHIATMVIDKNLPLHARGVLREFGIGIHGMRTHVA